MTISSQSRRARWIMLIVIVLGISVLEPRLVFPKTGSVRYHALFIGFGTPAKGDYVNVEIDHPQIDPDKTVTLTKRVGCMPGEQLTFHDGQHFCGNTPLGLVLSHDSKGRPLEPFAWNGPVPAGKVYLTGDHERSFDSRYLGFFDLAGVTVLWPLF